MDDPSKTIALATERLEVLERVRRSLTPEDGVRAVEAVDTYCRRWSELLFEAQRRLSENSE